jgi:hypothetical protein
MAPQPDPSPTSDQVRLPLCRMVDEDPATTGPEVQEHPGWAFHRRLGSPKYVVAPMVSIVVETTLSRWLHNSGRCHSDQEDVDFPVRHSRESRSPCAVPAIACGK